MLPSSVVDLLAALQASIDATKAHRHPQEPPAVPAQAKTSRNNAAKPTTAQKKAAAKKTTRRKPA